MDLSKLAGRLKWDLSYVLGHWNYIDRPPDPDLANAINAHLRGGSILDLGCGTANTIAILKEYASYQGVDVSAVALLKAHWRYAGPKNKFVVADLEKFEPSGRYNVMVLSEVIYYVPLDAVCSVLQRYRSYLADNGIFIIRIWDAEQMASFIRVITEAFHVIENKRITGIERAVILTFR